MPVPGVVATSAGVAVWAGAVAAAAAVPPLSQITAKALPPVSAQDVASVTLVADTMVRALGVLVADRGVVDRRAGEADRAEIRERQNISVAGSLRDDVGRP